MNGSAAPSAAARLFIALPAPPELAMAVARYEKELPFWRWYGPRELHLTMRFLGDTPADKTDALAAAFESAFSSQRMVRFTTLGCAFNPGARRAQSIHLLMQYSHAMAELKEKVDSLVGETLGLVPEARPFLAHVTLARFRRPPVHLDLKRLQEWARKLPKLPEPFAPKIVLYRSELTRHGAIHTPLAHYELERPL